MARVRDPERYEAQRVRILSESARIFREHGYAKTTMEDLAVALGVTKAAIYHYYRRKEEILFDICEQALELAFETTIEADATLPAKDRLERFVRGGIASVAGNMEVFAVLFQEPSLKGHPRAKAIVKRQRHFETAVQQIVEAGIADGAFRSSLEPRLATLAILAMCNWVYRWYGHEKYDVETIGDQFVELLHVGMSGPAAKSRR